MVKNKRIDTKIMVLLTLLVALIVISIIMTSGTFVSLNNIRNVLQTTVTVSLLTIGAGMLMIGGYVDLSLGAIGTFGALVTAFMLRAGVFWLFALLIGLAGASLFGIFNATLITYLKIPAFIATLATSSIAQGFGSMVCEGVQIPIKNTAVQTLGGGRMFGYFPYALIISLVLLLVYGIMLKRTAFGRSIYLVGCNAEAARLCGMNPRRVSYILFINASCLAALAGTLLAGRLKYANSQCITGSQYDGITAGVLGGISVGGGTGGMGGALIGILILNCFENLTTLIGLSSYWQEIASGLLLLVALLADFVIMTRKRSR